MIRKRNRRKRFFPFSMQLLHNLRWCSRHKKNFVEVLSKSIIKISLSFLASIEENHSKGFFLQLQSFHAN